MTAWTGKAAHIVVATARGAPAQCVDSAEAVPGRGLTGDRYAAKKKLRPADEVTLIEIEHIEAFNQATGLALTPEMPRRNVVTRGVPLDELIGQRFTVGAVVLEGMEPCEPCSLFAKRTYREILPFFKGKGGLRARIVAGGIIRAGDAIAPLPPARARKVVVTGSAGHLGEALVRTLRSGGYEVASLDVLASPFTDTVATVTDREAVRRAMQGAQAVFHAAALHKPHIVTHSRQDFFDVNVSGTLVLLEEALAAGVSTFIYTSTTSAFGRALVPPPGAPAAWVTEEQRSIPRNIYGVTKTAAEDLCELFHVRERMACIVLRTSRFFPEEDDRKPIRDGYDDENVKANEYLYRRVDIEDVVGAHFQALEKAPAIGFGRYIISATTPFHMEDLGELRTDAPAVLARRVPGYEAEYRARGWRMFPDIDRVYVNEKARRELGWKPRHDFAAVLERLRAGGDPRSALARRIGSKGYHDKEFAEGPFPVEDTTRECL
jgi:UDP-glucose 4-epimerase